MRFKEVPRSESQRNLFWRVFLLFLRISTPAENKNDCFSPESYKKIVVDSGNMILLVEPIVHLVIFSRVDRSPKDLRLCCFVFYL